MADEEITKSDQEEKPINNTGLLILEQLQIMNRLLGTINQNITSTLKPMQEDLERCKVTLSRLKKMGAQDVTITNPPASPAPYVPPQI
jgi:hypothetical protein